MKKVVQKLMLWSAAIAVALSASGSAKAATLADIVSSLQTSGYTVNQQSLAQSQVAFVKTGDIGINVIESTDNAALGFTRGTGVNKTNDVILATKRFANGNLQGFDTFTKSADYSGTLGITGNVAVKLQDSIDNTQDTGLATSKKLDANVIGNGGFHFFVKQNPQFTGSNAGAVTDRTIVNLGNGTISMGQLNPGYGSFSEYTISGTGKYANSYLIAYTAVNSKGDTTLTFAAIVSGVTNPEPASIAMLGTGVLGLAGLWRRRRNAANAVVAAV